MLVNQNINYFFEELIGDIKCSAETKSYIVGVYAGYRQSKRDLSQDSITHLFAKARFSHSFQCYQDIADWILWSSSFAPNHLRFATKDYYETIARLSYYSCYRIIDKKWKVYEELADQFPYIENQITKKLSVLKL